MTSPHAWLVTREAVDAAAQAEYARQCEPEGPKDVPWDATSPAFRAWAKGRARNQLEAAAPLIAARVLREVADDQRHRWPPWVALALTAEADRIAKETNA